MEHESVSLESLTPNTLTADTGNYRGGQHPETTLPERPLIRRITPESDDVDDVSPWEACLCFFHWAAPKE